MPGYVSQPLREELRKLGCDVRVVEIKGLLQDTLEELYRAYVIEEIGSDIYYDPKDMRKSEIPRRYRESFEYGAKCHPHKIKTGCLYMGRQDPTRRRAANLFM